jgi:type IV secretory pathway VirB9-like protein
VRDSGFVAPPMPAPSLPPVTATAPIAPVIASTPSAPPSITPPFTQAAASSANYNYTYTGNPAYAPGRVYDDGKNTYVKLNNPNTMNIKFLTDVPVAETPLNATKNIDGSFIINSVAKSFTIQYDDGQQIQVYNETKM